MKNDAIFKIRRLFDGGKFDMTDSPKSFMTNVIDIISSTQNEGIAVSEDTETLQERAAAWNAVSAALSEVSPSWTSMASRGMDCAVAAIHTLAGVASPVGQDARDAGNRAREFLDAERYRWLRSHYAFSIVEDVLKLETGRNPQEQMDSAIDEQYDAATSTAPASEPVTERHITPAPGPADGWCSKCGCGNDKAGFAHLAGCTGPTPATSKAASVDTPELRDLVSDFIHAPDKCGDSPAKDAWNVLVAHIDALREAARREGHMAGRRNGARDEAAAQADSIAELNATIERLQAAQAGSELAGRPWVDDWMGRNDVVLRKEAYAELCTALAKAGEGPSQNGGQHV